MHFCYILITYLFYLLAPIYLYFRKLRKKEDFVRYKEKLSKINIPRDNGFLIWFHVASVGEAMSILPLIENCIEEKKIDKILLTSITLSSGKILENKFSQNTKVIHQFLPLDIPILTKKFFQDGNKNLVLKNNFSFNKPVILIHGLKDKDVSPKVSEKILKKISSNKVEIRYLKNSGHRLSSNNDLKKIHNAIDNILSLN